MSISVEVDEKYWPSFEGSQASKQLFLRFSMGCMANLGDILQLFLVLNKWTHVSPPPTHPHTPHPHPTHTHTHTPDPNPHPSQGLWSRLWCSWESHFTAWFNHPKILYTTTQQGTFGPMQYQEESPSSSVLYYLLITTEPNKQHELNQALNPNALIAVFAVFEKFSIHGWRVANSV